MNKEVQIATKMNDLLEIYGFILAKRQREIMNCYYAYNLSITEIAEELSITRSAVEDSLSKAKTKLIEYDNNLFLIDTSKRIVETIALLKKEDHEEEANKLMEVLNRWHSNH